MMARGRPRLRQRRRLRLRHVAAGGLALVVAVAVAVVAALTSLDREELRAAVEQQAERMTGREFTTAGPLDLQVSLSPAVVMHDVSMANASWGSREAMATAERFEVELALLPLLWGTTRVHRLVLVRPDVLLERNADGRGNWELPGLAGEAKQGRRSGARTLPDVRRLRIADARLTYRTADGRETHLALSRVDGRTEGPEAPVRLDIAGSYRGIEFRAHGELGSPSRLAAGGEVPLDLRAEAAGGTLEAGGTVARSPAGVEADVRLALAGGQLAELGAAAGLELPQAGPYRIGGRLTGDAAALALEGLEVTLGDSDLAGRLRLDLGTPRPRLEGSLKGAVLDLAALHGGDGAAAADKAGAEEGRVFPATPLPLAALKTVDAEIAFKIGTVRLSDGLRLSPAEGKLRLTEGRLGLRPLRAGLAGGRVDIAASLDAGRSPAGFALELDAGDVDYGRLLADLDRDQGVVGKADLHASLGGSGGSPRAIAASLGGDLELVGGEGRIAGRTLRLAGSGLGALLQPWTEREADMKLNCVLARFELQDGVATSRALLVDTETVTFAGDGEVDLRDESLDLRVVPKAKQASLMSLAVPVRLRGRLAEPHVAPDAVGTAKAGALAFGTLVNPLVTLGVLLAESQSAEQNPCVAALEQARQEAPAGASAAGESGAGAEGSEAASGGEEGGLLGGVKDALEGLGKEIDRQLGVDKP